MLLRVRPACVRCQTHVRGVSGPAHARAVTAHTFAERKADRVLDRLVVVKDAHVVRGRLRHVADPEVAQRVADDERPRLVRRVRDQP